MKNSNKLDGGYTVMNEPNFDLYPRISLNDL